jgi:hypothetical protein
MIIAEHEGDRVEWECDEYPAGPPDLGSFWADNDGFIYFCYDYDHTDHAVYLLGVGNKYSDKARRHNGEDYCEELFHFDNLYTEEVGTDEYHKTLTDELSYEALLNFWDILKLHEDEKRLILLGKAP